MVRATHSKTNTVYIAFIILYFITIEEVYCGPDDQSRGNRPDGLDVRYDTLILSGENQETARRNRPNARGNRPNAPGNPPTGPTQSQTDETEAPGNPPTGPTQSQTDKTVEAARSKSMEYGRLPGRWDDQEERKRKLKDNDLCLSRITKDINGIAEYSKDGRITNAIADPKDCFLRIYNSPKHYRDLRYYTTRYGKYVFQKMLSQHDYIKSLNDDCNDIICIQNNKAFGYWHRYGHSSLEYILLKSYWTKPSNNYVRQLNEQLNRSLEDVKSKFLGIIDKTNWNIIPGPSTYCSIKCKEQIEVFFNGCTTFDDCATYAYKFLVRGELLDLHATEANNHALHYMDYIYENIFVVKASTTYNKYEPMSKDSILLMSPINYCMTIAERLMENTKFDAKQWVTRVLACSDDMVEAGINMDLRKERFRFILTAFQKQLQKLKNHKKGILTTGINRFSAIMSSVGKSTPSVLKNMMSRKSSGNGTNSGNVASGNGNNSENDPSGNGNNSENDPSGNGNNSENDPSGNGNNSENDPSGINSENVDIKDIDFNNLIIEYLRLTLDVRVPTEDTNLRYFRLVYNHVSLDTISRSSDAYSYVDELIEFTNIGKIGDEKYSPSDYCGVKEAEVWNADAYIADHKRYYRNV